MDKNPLMDAFRKEFLRQTERAGFHHLAGEHDGEDICYKSNTVATLTAEYGLNATGELGTKQLFDQLQHLRWKVLEPYSLFQKAPTLTVCDDPDTRVLCAFDSVALTARVRPDGVMEYGTCQYRHDRTGVRDFTTPDTNFSAVKEQFTIRADLAPKELLFTIGEMGELAHACAFCIAQYPGLNADRKEALTQLKNRLQHQVARENAEKIAQAVADPPEIAICQAGVPVGLFEKRIEPGYLLEDGAVLLESERDMEGNYLGGAGMDGVYLKTGAVYAPVLNGAGHVRAFRTLDPWREKARELSAWKSASGKRGQSTPER